MLLRDLLEKIERLTNRKIRLQDLLDQYNKNEKLTFSVGIKNRISIDFTDPSDTLELVEFIESEHRQVSSDLDKLLAKKSALEELLK